MSKEFIEFIFPCSSCIVRAACEDQPNENSVKKTDLYDLRDVKCLTLPIFDPSEQTYHKMLLECYSNFGKRLVDSIQKRFNVVCGTEEYNSIPIEYLRLFQVMTSMTQYMVNSTSWREGILFNFDINELKQKMKGLQL